MTHDGPPATRRLDARRSLLTGLVGGALVIAVVTVVARVVGFGRIVVFSRSVGPSTCLGDAYFTANTVPNIVFEVVAGGALASLVVPVLAGPIARGARDEAGRIAGALLGWALLVLTPIAIAGIWLARPTMELLVGNGGCEGDALVDTGTRMLHVFLPQIPLYGVGIVLVGVLQAHRRFIGPALAPLLSSLVVIAAYLLFAARFTGDPDELGSVDRNDELILSVGTTLGVAILSLSLLVPLARLGLPMRPTLRFPAGVSNRVRALAYAGLATLVAQQISVAVVLRLANDGGTGGAVTLYNLAWTVFLLPWAVLAVPIATSAFPRLSASASDRDEAAYVATNTMAMRLVLVTSLAAAAVLVATADPVARVLAQNAPGANPDDVDALASSVLAFAPGLIGYALVAHLGRALYARHAGRAAAAAISIGWLTVIVADVLLVAATEAVDTVPALALGNTIGMTVAGVLLVVALLRAAGPASLIGLGRTALVGFLAAAAASAVGHLVVHGIDSEGVALSAGSGALGAVFALMAFVAVVFVGDRSSMRALRRGLSDASS